MRLRTRNIFGLLLSATVLSGAAPAQRVNAGAAAGLEEGKAPTAVRPLPFAPGEQLVYEGEFSKLLLRGIEIAEFRFTTERAQPSAAPAAGGDAANGTPAPNLVFKSEATAKGWFRKLFGIDFRFQMESQVDSRDLAILRTSKVDEQGKRVRTSEALFDRERNLISWTERNPKDPQGQPHVVSAPLAGAMHDFISAVYYLRTQPLAPGQSYELTVSDSGETYHIPVRVAERKRMKTVLGRVQTVRVDVEVFGAGRLIADRKGRMSLWVTDDARRLPVRARLDADLGEINITLKKIVAAPAP